jgi:mercuric ion transport protein
MSDAAEKSDPLARPAGETGAALLAAGGFAAAFGAASCCALPVLLGSFGLGAAWLFGLASLAAPHRTALLAAAAVCLAGGALLLWRHRTASIRCAPDSACLSNPAVRYLTAGGLAVGAVLLTLGYAYP